jgi:hypothetical protein
MLLYAHAQNSLSSTLEGNIMTERSRIRGTLLVHLVGEDEGVCGQTMVWFDMPDSFSFCLLIQHLERGTRATDLEGTMDVPTESERYQCIRSALGCVYHNPFFPDMNDNHREALVARVMQIIPESVMHLPEPSFPH